jgi:hypothetical protein
MLFMISKLWYKGENLHLPFMIGFGNCDNELCVCPTPTPTPTIVCKCNNYNIFNGGVSGYFSYTDCDNIFRTVYLEKGATVAICSCSDKSLILPQFFTYVLGMRLVKKTINQDDIQTYHLFFSDDNYTIYRYK